MAQKQNDLFRRSALERLSSPEELDRLITVTTPGGWLALLALLLLLSAFVVWGWFGSIRTTVSGEGILLRGDRIETVELSVSGQVTNIFVAPNELVQRGERIANVYNPETNEFTFVRSAVEGRVIELRVSEGNTVGAGTTFMSVEPTGGDLQAILYLAPNVGLEVAKGDIVYMVVPPATAEEEGYLIGQVTDVADFTSTPQGMLRILGSMDLVDRLRGDVAPIEIRVKLFASDEHLPSGYTWTSPDGAPFELRGGTVVEARIVVEEQRPIELVLVNFGTADEEASSDGE